MTLHLHRQFAWLATGIVALALIWGLVLVGSPGAERQRKFDERKLEDLRVLQSEMMNIVHDGYRDPMRPITKLKKPLPRSLDEVLAQAEMQRPHLTDPETGERYGYQIVDPTHFELCATFTLARDQEFDLLWNHPAGHHCFSFDALDVEGKSAPVRVPVPRHP